MLAVLLLLSGPLVFTDRSLGTDWTYHLWLAWSQQGSISESLRPTYFMHSRSLGLFYPFFAFYGGTFYALSGLLGVLTGSITTGFVLVTLTAMAFAYSGWYWLARIAGVGPIAAHAPAAVVVSSAYYLTLIYARGAVPEQMAVSVLPLAVAAGIHLVQAPRIKAIPFAAFAISIVLFFGSHNISMLWAATLLLILGAFAVTALQKSWLIHHRRRIMFLIGTTLLAVAVNAWTLVTIATYSSQVAGATNGNATPARLIPLESLGYWLHPFRMTTGVAEADWLLVRVPIIAAIWTLLVLSLLWHRRISRIRTATTAGLVVIGAFLVVTVAFDWPWAVLPDAYNFVQFRYRLSSYLTWCIAGLMIIALLFMAKAERSMRKILGSLCFILVTIGLGLGIWQSWQAKPLTSRRAEAIQDRVVTPEFRGDAGLFFIRKNFGTPPVVSTSLNPHSIRRDQATYPRWTTGSSPVLINITSHPELINIDGASIVGRHNGGLVLSPDSNRTTPLQISAAWPPRILYAWIVSALAAIILAAMFVWFGIRDVRLDRVQRRKVRANHKNTVS